VNVIEIFQDSARRHAAAAAIVAGWEGRETSTSFAELDRRSRQIAALLLQHGLQPGDGVAVLVPMSADLYAVMAALLRLGMVPIFAEPAAWRQTFDRPISALPLRGFIGVPAACAVRLLVPMLRRIPKVFVAGAFFPGAVSLRAARTLAPCEHLEAAAADRPAILTFTSGSTGRPKFVLRSHVVLAETHRVLSTYLGAVPGELDVAVLPLLVFTNLGVGVGSLIPDADLAHPGAIDAPRLARQIQAWSPTGIVASPALLERVADDTLARGSCFLFMRRIIAGGAPVFPRLLDKLAAVAPRARVQALYGATEAEPIAALAREEYDSQARNAMHQGKGLLVGRPIPELALRILRDRFGEACGTLTPAAFDAAGAAVDQAGEIIVSGRHVVAGHLDGQGDRESKIQVGAQVWHRTGDAGQLDAAGRLWMLGPCSARVEDDRGCRYPLAVDAALSDHPAVSRATLVRHRERTLLIVQPRGEPTHDDLVAIARSLAWAGADEVVAMRQFPLDHRHNAKIDQPRLRHLLDEKRWLLRAPISTTDVPPRAG
jgi:acyl-CoA synthetase (AMP-forming)/AMP-acid ligase II